MNVYTIGYEGRSIEDFVELLKKHGVEVLADVRHLPLSRKKGFSKTALGNALEDAGIRYEHFRQVGNPKHIRKSGLPQQELLAAYDDHMSELWDEALPDLVETATDAATCLMCYELEPCDCHRTSVAKQLIARMPGATLIEI